MIILDTNVVSALMSDPADGAVTDWLDRQPRAEFWTTAITVFEIRSGIDQIAPSRRRERLDKAFNATLEIDLGDNVAYLDRSAGEAAGRIAARARSLGRQMSPADALIAGIVAAHGATLATRNPRHFAGLGIDLVDPWTGEPE